MKYTLLKNQHHVDDPVYLVSGVYKGITFPQRSTFIPGDDLGLISQLPSYKFKLDISGFLSLTVAFRLIQQPALGNITVVPAAYIQHPAYKNRKLILKGRRLTNGPCDTTIQSVPFYIHSGTKFWLDLWQMNSHNINMRLEYCYMGVRVDD